MFLITSDIHLTDNRQDEYRWGVFDFLIEKAEQQKCEHVFILGDITDAKDNHSSLLVNRIVQNFMKLSRAGLRVRVLMGNHDFIDPDHPFFEFLNLVPNLSFIKDPRRETICDKRLLFIPYTKNLANIVSEQLGERSFDYVFTHATYDKSRASNGFELNGVSTKIFAPHKVRVYSGDIHVPQTISQGVTYVGSPYHVRFGDTYIPRILLIRTSGPEENQSRNLHFTTVRKHSIEIKRPREISNFDISKNDQLKVRLCLMQSEFHMFGKLKNEIVDICNQEGWDLHGVELKPRDTSTRSKKTKKRKDLDTIISKNTFFDKYVASHRPGKTIVKIGKEILDYEPDRNNSG